VIGPFSADAFFARGHHREFDAVLAMYHDQGLIPFKSLSVSEGVNFTAGLPGVRTSPDHGTAFDIAGKNLADHSSFLASVYKCLDIIEKREFYYGSSFLSQSGRFVNINDNISSITILDNKGIQRVINF